MIPVSGIKGQVRLFSFSGGLKICRYSNMPKADEVMQQLIDLGKDTVTVNLTAVDGKERETRVFSFPDGWLGDCG